MRFRIDVSRARFEAAYSTAPGSWSSANSLATLHHFDPELLLIVMDSQEIAGVSRFLTPLFLRATLSDPGSPWGSSPIRSSVPIW